MLRILRSPITKSLLSGSNSAIVCSESLSTVAVGPEHHDIPAGHAGSDMRAISCNIGLNRRRDLSLRSDLRLHSSQESFNLRDIFRGKLVVMLGVPDMGKVCAECHVPNYVDYAQQLRDVGVDDIICVAVAPAEKAEAWGKKIDLKDSKIRMLGDTNGGFARLLGVDLNLPEDKGPHSQRYAALVEDGILLKLKVEERLKDVKDTSADCILDYLKYLQSLE